MTVDQAAFARALLTPETETPAGLLDPEGRRAGKRFDVYRNNVAVSLAEALEAAFPVLLKLLGESNFRTMAAVYLRRYPPRSPLMMFYGVDMPGFLEAFEPAKALGYLPDVARLELALRESYHAADADPIAPEMLQSIPPDRLMGATVSLAPSLRLLQSHWPVHAIWAYNMVPDSPKPEQAAQDVAIVRPGYDPEPILLPAGAAAFLTALTEGRTFGSAVDAGTAASPEFDLSAVLGIVLTHSLFIDLKAPE